MWFLLKFLVNEGSPEGLYSLPKYLENGAKYYAT